MQIPKLNVLGMKDQRKSADGRIVRLVPNFAEEIKHTVNI